MLGSEKSMADCGQAVTFNSRKLDITIGENLDQRIKQAEERLQELKDTKQRMEATGLLTARIDDIQRAMNY
jgi:hypothetical protein